MNTFANLLPSVGGNRPPLSDEELRRLAAMLQDRGEGLAAINPQEAKMLKDAGGSGEPIPGTQGFGVGGGPIRSYEDDDSDDDDDSTESTIESVSDIEGYDEREAYISAVENQRNQSGDDNDTPPPAPPPPPKFYDQYGNEYPSQEAADAANRSINAERDDIKSKFLKGDDNWEAWWAQNKSLYPSISEEDAKKTFAENKLISQKEVESQTSDFKSKVVNFFNDGTFSARGKRVRNDDGTIKDVVPTTFEEADAKMTELYPDSYGRMSDQMRREVLEQALKEFARIEAFTLTLEDVERFARPAPTMDTVTDITATDIATVADATAPTVGAVDDVTQTTLNEVLDVASDAGELSNVIDDEDALIEVLKSRVAGDEPSVAEIQLKRGTEQNLKALLATTAGVMDPTKLRQTRNMWMDIQQVFTGQKAELRAAEQVQAEQNLLAVLKAKGTREASIQIANMEKDIQVAITEGNLDQARKIKNQQAALTLVTIQAEIEKDVRLANLDKERIIAIEEGKMDLATKIANLEKEILISKVNAQIAIESRRMDDALGIAAYQGEQALQGLETEIDMAQMKDDLTRYGFEIQKDLALMDRETKLAVARLVNEYKAEAAKADRDSDRLNSILGAVATVGAAYLRFKTGV